MFQPSSHPAAELSAYEYNRQATEDHDDQGDGAEQLRKPRQPRANRPDYKPTALTWPFIVTQILVLCLCIGLIIWAEKAMPDSDNTAIIDSAPTVVKLTFPSRVFRRDNSSNTFVVSTAAATNAALSTSIQDGHSITPPVSGESTNSASETPLVASSSSKLSGDNIVSSQTAVQSASYLSSVTSQAPISSPPSTSSPPPPSTTPKPSTSAAVPSPSTGTAPSSDNADKGSVTNGGISGSGSGSTSKQPGSTSGGSSNSLDNGSVTTGGSSGLSGGATASTSNSGQGSVTIGGSAGSSGGVTASPSKSGQGSVTTGESSSSTSKPSGSSGGTASSSNSGQGSITTGGSAGSSGGVTTSPSKSGQGSVTTEESSSSTSKPSGSSGGTASSSNSGQSSVSTEGSSISTGGSTTLSPTYSGGSSSSRSGSPSSSGPTITSDGSAFELVKPTASNSSYSEITITTTSNFTITGSSKTSFTSTITVPATTTTFPVTQSTVRTTVLSTTRVSTRPASTSTTVITSSTPRTRTAYYSYSVSGSGPPPPPSTVVDTSEEPVTITSLSTIQPTTLSSTGEVTTTIPTTTVVFSTSTVPATTSETVIQTFVPYISTGQTVITSVSTVVIEQQPITEQPKTQEPTTIVATRVTGGQAYTIIETFAPETKVIGDTGLRTQVNTPPPHTYLSIVGGTATTNYIVITPTPTTRVFSTDQVSTVGAQSITYVQTQDPQTIVTSQGGSLVTLLSTPPPQTQITVINGQSVTLVQTQAPQTIVTSQGGTLVTLVNTPPPQTQVSVVGGTLTTVGVPTTSTGFQPITFAVTTTTGATTSVVTVTPPPTRVVTTINGTPLTMESTPPPLTYTTTFGGTLVTSMSVTTPTNSNPITLTLSSTAGGTLTTIVQTFAPTTFTTDISGTPTTIVSTPSPSTRLTTAPLSTLLYTTTSTPSEAASSTRTGPTSVTSVVISTKAFDLTSRDYFIGTFLPPILAVSIVIPLRIIDLNAKLYQPFNSLAQEGGASGYDALTLHFTGLMGFVTPAVTLLQGHPVPFITTLIVGCASFMVPLAVEAISVKLHGRCSLLSSSGCAGALGVSPVTSHALLGLIGFVIVLLLLLLLFLRKWVTGVNANPWNIAGMASLARNPDVRIHQTNDDAIRRAVADKQYGLGYYQTPSGREEYGILLNDESGHMLGHNAHAHESGSGSGDDRASIVSADPVMYVGKDGKRRQKVLPFMTLRFPWRIAFVLYLVALLVLIVFYDHTVVVQAEDPTVPHYTSFHLFFDSHSFGVRFLFAFMGVVITFCWQAFFVAIATIVPYHLMSFGPQPPRKSILLSRPTNAFSGIWMASRQRHLFFFVTSLMAIFSEFLPILLSNIPHKLTQVLLPTLVCTRLSAALLALMVLTVAWSFVIRWPPMPVDPRSVAGAMWYVCESRALLADLEGLSELKRKERDRRIEEMGKRYYYGDLMGSSRLGVDVDLGPGEHVVTAYLGADEGSRDLRSGHGGRDGDGMR